MLKRAVFCKPKNYICENIYVCTHTKTKTSYPIIYELNRKTIMQLTSPPCNSSRCLIFSLPSFRSGCYGQRYFEITSLGKQFAVAFSINLCVSLRDCCTPPSSEARNNDAYKNIVSSQKKNRRKKKNEIKNNLARIHAYHNRILYSHVFSNILWVRLYTIWTQVCMEG